MLADSIHSLLSMCDDPSRVECIIRCDHDDQATIDFVSAIGCSYVIGERFDGYASMHLFYDDCAAHSQGRWLMMWNDDARMLSRGWDEVIARIPRDVWMFKFNERDSDTNETAAPPIFPIFRREFYDAIGHVSMHPCNDSWIHTVTSLSGIGTAYCPGIKVRQPEDGDNKESCLKAEMYFGHAVYRRSREQDALKLKEAYEHWLDRSR